jgi:hypothetical protein
VIGSAVGTKVRPPTFVVRIFFSEDRLHNEKAARVWFEPVRWPEGPICRLCGSVKHYATEKIGRYRCGEKECKLYTGADAFFKSYEAVNHSAKEYARGDVTTNSAEGFFSVFKRGMGGVYQHCSEKHLHRYLSEFEFRYNHRIVLGYNDEERAVLMVRGAEGKRLTYQKPLQAEF